ncbi:hypothetical protein CONPUDRAFT_165780 [Coniophora puteana RWD-64-598 SS2]|uniref:Uncharacterized protein n=1 Tax=Coniophora puteana (strain RWD-64-598) TaxID=741705 RepID=A0A5M3MN88_CONPW|nr:uncharacterized protein CONPUDRAFT_165780 [Coniophora puteana RWD-64-598 SS2]EIW80185.1 hypothetical protein CONPUDRAFT_165780 [Coniophora puteana RWD-64-598 SS2]
MTMLRPQRLPRPGRLWIFVSLGALLSFTLFVLASDSAWLHESNQWLALAPYLHVQHHLADTHPHEEVDQRPPPLKHTPRSRLQDALIPSQKYIAALNSAGFANQVISTLHLIQLAQRTDRIPIVPPFYPAFLSQSASFLPFGDVFNVSHLYYHIEGGTLPAILEYTDLKDTSVDPHDATALTAGRARAAAAESFFEPSYFGGDLEDVGCYSLSMTHSAGGVGPRHSKINAALSLDASFLPVPFDHDVVPQVADKAFLVQLASNLTVAREAREESERYVQTAEALRHKEVVPVNKDVPTLNSKGRQVYPTLPGEGEKDLVCFDYLYYTSWDKDEWDLTQIIVPSIWTSIGRHLVFSASVRAMALHTLSLLLPASATSGLPRTADGFPPYIAVHMRRNDFQSACVRDGVPFERCFASPAVYSEHVARIRQAILDDPGRIKLEEGASALALTTRAAVDKIPVLAFSDEPPHTLPADLARFPDRPPDASESFWAQVRELGWHIVDHSSVSLGTTTEPNPALDALAPGGKGGTYAKWRPLVIDTALQGHAVGFAGTWLSTYSEFAARRVESWTGGPAVLVRWGKDAVDF